MGVPIARRRGKLMRGIVLAFNQEEDLGVLRAEDGRRYRFAKADWREPRPPRKRDEVDFETDREAARDIYVLTPGPASGSMGGDAGQRVLSGLERVWSFLKARPEAGFALGVIAASILPLYTFSGVSVSLIGLGEGIARLSSALDSLRVLAQPAAMATTAAGLAKALLVLFFALFALPLLAGWLLIKVIGGGRRRRLAGITGTLTLVLPIGLPLMIAMVGAWLVVPAIPISSRPALSGALFDLGGFGVLRSFGPGVFVMALAGIGLIVWSTRGDRPIERSPGQTRDLAPQSFEFPDFDRRTDDDRDRMSVSAALRDAGQAEFDFDRSNPDLYGRPSRPVIPPRPRERPRDDVRYADPLEEKMAEALAGPVMDPANLAVEDVERTRPDTEPARSAPDPGDDVPPRTNIAARDRAEPPDDREPVGRERYVEVDPETERTMSHIGDLVRQSSPDVNGASAFDELADGLNVDPAPAHRPRHRSEQPKPVPPEPDRKAPEIDRRTPEPDAEIASVTRLYERLKAERLAQMAERQRRDQDEERGGG